MKPILARNNYFDPECGIAKSSASGLKTGIAEAILVLSLGLLLLTTTQLAVADDSNCTIAPSDEIDPETVVRTVVEALRSNSDDNEGIATVYCFASPGNKQMTGPLERFTAMIRSGYSNMLNHKDSEFEDIEVRDDVALQPVWLTTAGGEVVGYLFRLGKQTAGQYTGMWMTEAVYPIDPSKRTQSI